MTGTASTLPGPALGIDALAHLTEDQARAFWNVDLCRVAGLYIDSGDVATVAAYCAMLHSIGYAVLPLSMAVVSVPLDSSYGRQRGAQLVARAQALGIPATVHLWIDVESMHPDSDSPSFVAACATSIQAGGYGAGLYGGAGSGMTGAQAYALPPDRYMRPGNVGAIEPACGHCVVQHLRLDREVHGARIDYFTADCDALGRQPTLWMP
jgi:hypothetical protein